MEANHSSCFPLSFERRKSHEAPQEELILKAFGGHLYLLLYLYVLIMFESDINPRVQVWIPVQYGFQDETRKFGDLEQPMPVKTNDDC